MEDYTQTRNPKKKCKEGGGLGIYVKSEIKFIRGNDIECPDNLRDYFDSLFIEVLQAYPDKKNDIVLYRPPGNDTYNNY